MSTGLEPAWLLSQRPYGNSGRLIECFTAHQGRFSAVARGVHRKAHGGQQAQLLQLFYPLLIAVAGRQELKTLTTVEPAGVALRPVGNAAVCGMYVNELLIRLLPRFDPHPTLFAQYGETISQLADGCVDPALRRFEVRLLAELGYTISWAHDAADHPIDAGLQYSYITGEGFVATGNGAYAGAHLLAIADWLASDEDTLVNAPGTTFRNVTRQALSVLLGERPLRTRELARELDWGQSHD